MKRYKIIFVHGYNASSQKDWFMDVSRELTKLGMECIVPDMPGGEHPHADAWVETLHKIIGEDDQSLVLVGHSLGNRAILLYLEKYQKKAEAVFLVATHANTTDIPNEGVHKDFWEHKIDTAAIKPWVKKFVVIHSKDDPVIPYSQTKELAEELNAKFLSYEDRIHFSTPRSAPYVLEVLKKELALN